MPALCLLPNKYFIGILGSMALRRMWCPRFQLVPNCTIAVVSVPNAANEDDFGDFLSVPAQLAAASQPTQQIAANQKLVTSAAGPKAIVTEPPAAPKQEKKGKLRISHLINVFILNSLESLADALAYFGHSAQQIVDA